MMSWGGSPRCTQCGGAVYHAEQAIGPARKVYHKLCLKCLNCGKRLDPGGLVEHDSEPYCARCHTQLFGTRDLRSANVLPSSAKSTPTRTPVRPAHSPPRHTPLSPRPRPPATPDFYTPPRQSVDLPTAKPTPQSPLRTTNENEEVEFTRPNFRADRPISIPYAGGAKALDDRGMLTKGASPRSKVGEKFGGADDQCQGCGKRVYAAEQVFAIHHKWHRACLRCSSCKTTLDPSKVSDREGVPFCKNCYAKEHGPGGIMGKR